MAAQILREIPRSALEIPQDNLERLLLESYTIDGWVPTEMDVLGYHIPGLVGLGAVFAAVYGAFAKFDGDQSEENRKFVRDWLLGLKVDAGRWASFFQEFFVKAFGSKHLSAKCITRSFLLSVVIVTAIYAYGYIETHTLMFFTDKTPSYNAAAFVLLGLIAAAADYFSLWKTRIILTRSKLLHNSVVAVVVVVADAVARSLFMSL